MGFSGMVMNCEDVINTDRLSPRLAPSSVLPYYSHSGFVVPVP